jgi:hypothetical protein
MRLPNAVDVSSSVDDGGCFTTIHALSSVPLSVDLNAYCLKHLGKLSLAGSTYGASYANANSFAVA